MCIDLIKDLNLSRSIDLRHKPLCQGFPNYVRKS